MNKSILLLSLLGIALAILHIPAVMMPLAIIATLVFLTIKVFWSTMNVFSESNRSTPNAG
ncbi:MAG: hypothetical protein AAFQ63_01865 [Cyanobacteria bacterium J06621_11]